MGHWAGRETSGLLCPPCCLKGDGVRRKQYDFREKFGSKERNEKAQQPDSRLEMLCLGGWAKRN